jgi:uncharacterized protein YaeQ
MARGATIYRVHLELSHVDRGVYADRSLSLAQHPSETLERALVRLLAYGLRYAEDLEFGRGVSATDEPDLWTREGDGRTVEWIEVGQPEMKKLVKAARHARRAILFAFGEGCWRWRKAELEPLVDPPANLGVAHIDDAFVKALAAKASRQLRWSITVSEGIVFLSTEGASFETTPEVWLGDPLT